MAKRGGPNQSGAGYSGNMVPEGYDYGQIQQFTPEMFKLFNELFSHVGKGSFLERLAGGDQSMFDEIEAPQKQQFAGLQGNVASQFSGMGMGGRHGSSFQNYMTQGASDFAQQLGGQRMKLRQQAIQDLFNMSNMLLGQKPYDQYLTEEPQEQKKGGFGNIFGGALQGGMAGGMMGGVPGALAGGALGAGAGAFSKR